jgi:hypothetical protein
MKSSFEKRLDIALLFLTVSFPRTKTKISLKRFGHAIVVSPYFSNKERITYTFKTDEEIKILHNTLYGILRKSLGFDGDVLDTAIFTHLGLI